MSTMISSGITDLIDTVTTAVTSNAPPAIIGVMGVLLSVNLGFKLFKRFGSKIG